MFLITEKPTDKKHYLWTVFLLLCNDFNDQNQNFLTQLFSYRRMLVPQVFNASIKWVTENIVINCVIWFIDIIFTSCLILASWDQLQMKIYFR